MSSIRNFIGIGTVPSRAARMMLSTSLFSVVLSACTVGPNFQRPDPVLPSQYGRNPLPPATVQSNVAGGVAQDLVEGRDIPGEWWTLFHCAALNTLIEQSIRNNPDIHSAEAALRVAMESAAAQKSAFLPNVGGAVSASRNGNASQLSPTLANAELRYSLYQAQLNAQWTLDIWGANRRAVEALQAQAAAQRFQLEGSYLALTTNVVVAAVQEAELRAEISANEDIVADESVSLDIMRRQQALGQIAGADVAAQEAALAQTRLALPALKLQLARQRDQLTTLAGRFPSDGLDQTFHLDDMRLPQEVPVTLPSKLIEQRPDVRVAEENLHWASAEVGVAIGSMLPNLTLTANTGSVVTQVSQFFTPGNGFWTLAAGATQPIFEGGALLHKARAARASYEQSAAQYRSVVLAALQNVADALNAVQFDAESLSAAAASEGAAEKSLEITRRQLEQGAVSNLALLNAERTYQLAYIARIQAQASRYVDTAMLFQALGGGWWNRKDVADLADAQRLQR
jgi:NodT family efflux transporter outer membrane factor (OMF) lipoprotein